ncbi:MAG: hypothetical protein ABR497_12795, partial [Kiritimatiellia bacterium]
VYVLPSFTPVSGPSFILSWQYLELFGCDLLIPGFCTMPTMKHKIMSVVIGAHRPRLKSDFLSIAEENLPLLP